jgi:predicted permease
MRTAKRWIKRLRTLVRREAVERELDEELAFHLEMETEKNLHAGMTAGEARRHALLRFGGLDKHREEVRDARWLGWLNGVPVDARLGIRMLLKYPGLTVVGGVGMAVAIAIGAVFDASLGAASSPIPLDGGDRIVALEVWDTRADNQEGRILHDYATWREGLRSVESLGAYVATSRNLIVPGGSPEPVRLAEMTASGFGIAGVPPLLGRPLVPGDEAAGAPPVVVLGHDVWRSRFGGDPGVVGRELRLGTTVHTVVGVMPEGFGFPLNQRLWVPLRLEPSDYAPREGPVIQAFGRLAPGVSIEEAQAELTAAGNRLAAVFPATHRHLRPRVVQYGPHLLDGMQGWQIALLRGVVTLLLVVIAVNVAVLVFARTATRAGEIAVRSALGASRKRIVTQFFAEALVLAAASAAIGLAVAAVSLRRLESAMDGMLASTGGLPFWIDFRLSASAVLFAAGLATLAAVIVGVLPALRATGPRLETALRALGGATGMRLGRTWSLLVVAQVALTGALLPATIHYAVELARYGLADPGFPADEYLTTYVVTDHEVQGQDVAVPEAEEAAHDARYADMMAELQRRLESEPGVLGATLSLALPADEAMVRFEMEGGAAGAAASAGVVKYNRVDPGFFGTFRLPVHAGRTFEAGDLGPAASPVVVNRAFIRDVLGGADPLGRRIRFPPPDGPETDRWYEIVGVVGDLPSRAMEPDDPVAQVYRPLAPGSTYPLRLSVHTRGAPAAFAPRLRELAAAVEPTLQARDLQPLETVVRQLQGGMRMGALGLGLLTASVLLLSAAGIYALMSFTVTRRRREIGIRTALGAHPRRILAAILSRAALQLGIGAGLGLSVAVGIDVLTGGGLTGGRGRIVLPAVTLVILLVGLLATLGPARRGLRISPMEALRED